MTTPSTQFNELGVGCLDGPQGGRLDQALLVEKRLAPAGDGDFLEQPRLAERIVGDVALGFGPVIGIDDQDPAVAAGAVVVDQRAAARRRCLLAVRYSMWAARLSARTCAAPALTCV